MIQDLALAILKTGANVFLTGEPGSGKTHTVNRYVAWLRSRGVEPAVTASTGIAATHVSGMTIHSWTGIGIKDALTSDDLARLAKNERLSRRILKARVLIIDEISMLDGRVFALADAAIRAVRRNHLPFGGLQVVLVGDFFQLPPVSRDGRKAEFAFQSDAWAKLQPITCYLTGQYRQDDPAYLSVLGAVRSGAIHDEHRRILDGRGSVSAPDTDMIRLFSHNADVDRMNSDALQKLQGGRKEFEMSAKGPEHLIETLKRSCLSPEVLRLKIGAAVMFTRNSPQGSFVNGTLGRVVDFDGDTGYPNIETRDGVILAAEPMEWRIEDQGATLASLTQIPLRLAWAITIHKSQGMSLDEAVMDLGAAFEYGQGYVALSRVRRLSGLYLMRYNHRALEVHPAMLAQDGVFREASVGGEMEYGAQTSSELGVLHEQFVESIGGKKPGTPAEKAFSVAAVREEHPNAYARWTPDEERSLEELYRSGTSIKDIAAKLSRKRGGISSRLKKLGLVTEKRG